MKRPFLRLEPTAVAAGTARLGVPLGFPQGEQPVDDDGHPVTAPLSHASFGTMLGAASVRRATASEATSIGANFFVHCFALEGSRRAVNRGTWVQKANVNKVRYTVKRADGTHLPLKSSVHRPEV